MPLLRGRAFLSLAIFDRRFVTSSENDSYFSCDSDEIALLIASDRANESGTDVCHDFAHGA